MRLQIRQAQLMQVPYMLVVGDREMENNSVSMRKRDGTRENGVPTEQFATSVRDRIPSVAICGALKIREVPFEHVVCLRHPKNNLVTDHETNLSGS